MTYRAFSCPAGVRALAALILAAALAAWAAGPAMAGGCYKPVYYQALFEPEPQKAEGGDPRLAGASDYLAAKGEDPHAGGSGCMCGINNGRWDQMLSNVSPQDPARAPVAFQLTGIKIEFFDTEGRRGGQPVQISTKDLAGCFDLGLATPGHTPFNHPSGRVAGPQVLEQGENLLSCLCLGPEQRDGAGTAQVRVAHRPSVLARHLGQDLRPEGGRWQAEVAVGELAPGQARYYRLAAPEGSRELKVALAGGGRLYSRQGDFAARQADWQEGGPKSAGESWLMVRAGRDKASPTLRASFSPPPGRSPARGEPGWALTPVGPEQVRSFQAYILCGAGSPQGGAGEAQGFNWQGCCNAPR
jgi:hypothetical protein